MTDAAMDEERGRQPPMEKEEEDISDDTSSVFSWHHAEGPRSTRSLSRVRSGSSHRTPGLERSATLGSTISRILGRPNTFYHPLTQEKTTPDVLVNFDGPDDPYRPMNWPFWKKAKHTMLYGALAGTTSFSTSVYSPAIGYVAAEFGQSEEVSVLGLSLLLFGLGLGPLLWAPLSELYGRRISVMIPVFIGFCFTLGGATAANIQTLFICRFFMGFFSSAPITNTGGVLGDIWSPGQRTIALVAYSISVVGWPTLGPLVGAAICESYLGWRWTQYLTAILQISALLAIFFFVEETYPAALLVHKARRLRHESGNWALHAKLEEWDVSFDELAHKYLVRPVKVLMTPIGALMVFYASFVYGLIYACLGAFTIIFEDYYGWSPVVATLPFLAELIGIVFGSIINIENGKRYIRKMEANNGKPVPEARLYPMMFGSPLLAGGIFILAWTAENKVFWVAPNIGIILIGAGFFTIFQGCLNYLIDTFQVMAASAIAANTFVRSMLAGAFPLFLTYQLTGIGVGWGLSVYGFVAAALLPVPYVFFIFGKRIREKGKYGQEE